MADLNSVVKDISVKTVEQGETLNVVQTNTENTFEDI